MPMLSRLIPCLLLASLLGGCETLGSLVPWGGKSESADATPVVKTKVNTDPSATPVEELYNNGVDALNNKRYKIASQQFDNVEQYYPYSTWATNAQLMHGYTEYLRNNYTD